MRQTETATLTLPIQRTREWERATGEGLSLTTKAAIGGVLPYAQRRRTICINSKAFSFLHVVQVT
jgi:hypothetical protein